MTFKRRQAAHEFEARWETGCGKHGTIGSCPAGVWKDVYFDALSETASQRTFCGGVREPDGLAVQRALAAEGAALRACFAGAAAGAWVEVALEGEGTDRSPGLPDGPVSCVQRIAKRVLADLDPHSVSQRQIRRIRSQVMPSGQSLSMLHETNPVSTSRSTPDITLKVMPGASGAAARDTRVKVMVG